MKLLVVNLQNPHDTQYRNPKKIGIWMMGRSLHNYPMFAVTDTHQLIPIDFDSPEVNHMQRTIDKVFGN